MKTHSRVVLWLILVAFSYHTVANNIAISNLTLTDQNTDNGYYLVAFDLSWENSWRAALGPANWDAAWIFIKYRTQSSTDWRHGTLHYVDGSGTGDGHTVPNNAVISSSNDTGAGGANGVFLHRSSELTQSTVTYTEIELRWDYAIDGLSDNAVIEIAVFAIEMVYIPEGNYILGDGDGISESTYSIHSTDNTHLTISDGLVTNIGVDVNANDDSTLENLLAIDGDEGIDIDGDNIVDNDLFPTGYTSFYVMKYELSQGQYAEFLNTLTSSQDNVRYDNGNFGSARYTITGNQGERTTDTPDRACNFLSWSDVCAYSDWAGLRPLTELEYEKSARGSLPAQFGEYAWGSTNIHTSAYNITNDGLTNETVDIGSTGNASYSTTDGSTDGPLRCGIFSGSGSTTREESGSSYFGVMELSGNLWEHYVSIGLAVGRSFTGVHGDGSLSTNGHANVANWPGDSGGEIINNDGAGQRGSSWISFSSQARISDRYFASSQQAGRQNSYGGRLGRTAP